MYYGLRGNRIHSWLLKKKPYYWYMGTFFILGALFFIWFIFLYQPLNCFIGLEQQRFLSLQEQCMNGVAAQEVCTQLEQKVQENKQVLTDSAQVESTDDYLTFLIDHVAQARLHLCSCSRNDESVHDGLMYHILNCKFLGTLEQLLHFFDRLIQSGKYLGCNQLSLTHDDNKQFDISCSLDYFS
ncbi:hypothetical protein E3J79_01145 [Candidatus Dependentiae bacterium]|nr:MAG: hypothetical protein E3J79_01145 [Candidatus Dependentiae bacterium]